MSGAELLADEESGAARGIKVARLGKGGAGLGEGGDHEAVPGGEDFIVEMRPRAFVALLKRRVRLVAREGSRSFLALDRGCFCR